MKKLISKKNISVILFLMFFALSNLQLLAQKAPAEFTFHGAGGVSLYAFQPAVKASSLGYNADFGLGFNGFFSRQFGIHIGAGIGYFNVTSKVAKLETITYGKLDQVNGLYYDLYTTLSGYSEIHQSLYVNIPVMFIFQTAQNSQHWNRRQAQKPSFYAMGGVKVLLLFNNKYEAGVKSLFNKAYYTALGSWAGTQTFAGYGNFDNHGKGYSNSGKITDFGIMAAFAAEVGVKWHVSKNAAIYTGAYFDCGLHDPIKDSRQPYEKYISEEDLQDDLTIMKFSNRANLMTAGIRVRFSFSKRQRGYY